MAIIDPRDLNTRPRWWLNPNVPELDFKSGKAAFLLECEPRSASLSDRHVASGEGSDLFEVTLQASFRNVRFDVEYLRQKLRNRRVDVVGTYANGDQRFVPTMRLLFDGSSGSRGQGRNGYTLAGSTRMLQVPAFVEGTMSVIEGGVVTPPPDGEAPGFPPISNTTSSTTYTFNIPAGRLLLAVYISSTANTSTGVLMGTTAGGSELGGPSFGNLHYFAGLNLRTGGSAVNIYFSGLAGTSQIEVWTIG